MKNLLLLAFILLINLGIGAQITISGTLTDAVSAEPQGFIQVVLYAYQSEKVIAYAYSEDNGKYILEIPRQSAAYTLRTNSLTHDNIQKDIVIAESELTAINVDMSLQPRSFTIDSVQVTAKLPPVIVKEDTIIYSIAAFSDETDQTLEEVLRKIPGFEVLADGELKVKGKVIGKVLINGEEISDGGAALLTRGLNHGRVKSVEVRFKEENERLRESLLSNSDLVVLDIKLKDDFATSLFGRATLTAGHEDASGVRPGGVGNLFSLNKKTKLHLVAEYDNFGDQTISLAKIKNIGKEAYAAIFDVPADFSRIRANPEFQSEIYGFKEADSYELGSVGLSGKVIISPSIDLYVGSYNYLSDVTSSRQARQSNILDDRETFSFAEMIQQQLSGSKNKLELNLNRKGLKASYNFNAIFTDSEQRLNSQPNTNSFNLFEGNIHEKEFYHNFLFERKTSEEAGYQIDFFLSHFDNSQSSALTGDGESITNIFSTESEGQFSVLQNTPLSGSRLIGNTFYKLSLVGQQLKVGARVLQDQLLGKKIFFLNDTLAPESNFTGDLASLRYQQALPFVEVVSSFGSVDLINKVGYSLNRYPAFSTEQRNSKELLEINSTLLLDLGDEQDLTLKYSRQTSRFTMAQLLAGRDLIGFQTIGRSGVYPLHPQFEQVLQFSVNSWALDAYGIGVELLGIAGQAKNGSGFNTSSFPFIEETYDQLASRYAIGLLKVAKVFEQLPVQLKFEQSLIVNEDENRTPNEGIYAINTRILLTNFRAITTFKSSPINLELGIKRNGILFSNELNALKSRQSVWNVNFKHRHYFLSRKIIAAVNWRYASFTGEQAAELLLVDADLSFKLPKFIFTLKASNLFDSQSISTQGTNSGYYFDDSQNIFGRYIRAGLTFDIN